jgi:hypothetical protein
MRRRALVPLLMMLALAGAVATSSSAGQTPAQRLIADNRTAYEANIYAWNGRGWNFVSQLRPRTWQAFPNAVAGSQWRAVIGQAVRDHRVTYVYNAKSGSYEDVWWIQ